MDIRSLLSPSDPEALTTNESESSPAGSSAARRSSAKPLHSEKLTSPAKAKQSRATNKQASGHLSKTGQPAAHQQDLPMTKAHRSDASRRSDQSVAAQPRHRALVSRSSASSNRTHVANGGSSDPASTSDRHRALDTVSEENTSLDTPFNRALLKRTAQTPILRTLSNRSLATVNMDTAPAQTPTPRNLSSDSLSSEDISTISALLSYLSENSYAYESHVQLVNLLHKGFEAHTAVATASSNGSYSLLAELRQAREAMDSRFALGEALWQDWLRDEIFLAQSSDERLALVELMQRAVQDEPASVVLWQMYVDYVEECVAVCQGVASAEAGGWSEEDKDMCRELFNHQMLLDIMHQAAQAVAWRIDASHLLWNKYLTSLQQPSTKLDGQEHSQAVPDAELEKLFIARLQTPHARLDTTLELFLPIVARLYGDNSETAAVRFEKMADRSRKLLKARDAHETKVQYAIDTNDQQGLLEAFEQYLKWDRTHKRRDDNDKALRCSLFERALLHFPTNRDWWIAYIDYVISEAPSTHNPSASLLPLIERATRHCPWSGELWARRILRSDYERLPHHDIEAVKHRATNSGMLDVGGMDDLLKVLVEWCSYLRRHAFGATATEDDSDTAEVGMTMALEDVQQAGKKLYGAGFDGDPLWRIEKIQIKFFSEARRIKDARAVWRSLVPSKNHSYEFWQHYYNYELTLWIHDRQNDRERVETTETGPKLATAVAEEAIAQHNLDWPEKIHELYVNHFQWHESVERLQDATIVAWSFQQKIAAKRAKEAAAQQAVQDTVMNDAAEEETESVDNKRKREDDATSTVNGPKKVKLAPAAEAGEAQPSADDQQKRDREHLTVAVTDLPLNATELDVRKLFRDCGDILSLAMTTDDRNNSASAVVEFSSAQDVESAKTRSGKIVHGREVHVRGGTLSTLYVANYPPEYDESAIRKLFNAYGDIVSVRFPSLKYNNRRRFCYVTFTSNEQAKAAEAALDNKMLDGMHKLLAKISNPDAKKQRDGAQAENRELFVKNIDNNASEDEVRTFFAQHGTVVRINLLKNVTGRRLGNAFVVYSTAEEATAAIEQLNNKPFNDRILQVNLAQPKGGVAPAEKARKTDIIVKHADGDTSQARRGSDVSMASTSEQAADSESFKTVRARQVAILDLPDTVTDARIITEMEKYGRVVKIQLRREKNAAIVEFTDVQAAFKVREGVDCTALGPQTKTADVQELFAKKGNKAHAMMPSQLGRPAAGGRRGGLGFKRGGLGSSSSISSNQTASTSRSNADFKALFEKSKKQNDK